MPIFLGEDGAFFKSSVLSEWVCILQKNVEKRIEYDHKKMIKIKKELNEMNDIDLGMKN